MNHFLTFISAISIMYSVSIGVNGTGSMIDTNDISTGQTQEVEGGGFDPFG